MERARGHLWGRFRDWERAVRNDVLDGKRHVYEAEMKEQRRTHGLPRHESRPPVVGGLSARLAAGRGVQRRPAPPQRRQAPDRCQDDACDDHRHAYQLQR